MNDAMTDPAIPPGDLRLLRDPIAERLLHSTELARLAYVATDGTPRVVPAGWVWNGGQIVFATFTASRKVAALRRNPQVAITIDRGGPPPEALLVRGRADVADVDGVPTEYREMQTRFYGADQAAAVAAEIERSGARMTVIAVTPTWVSALDFQTRFPQSLVDAGLAG